MTEEQFDELLKEMREEEAPPEQIAAARDRVWGKIAGSTSLACAELRPEFGAYLAGQLTESRRLAVRAGCRPHHGRLSRRPVTNRRLASRVEPAHRALRAGGVERADHPARSRRRHRTSREAAPRPSSRGYPRHCRVGQRHSLR